MKTQHLSLQTRFVQNTLVSQNDVSNNIKWQIGLKQQLNMLRMKNIDLASNIEYIYMQISIHIQGLEYGVVI